MRILVTGGAGFIGSHLCEKLLNEGHEVLCIDNFISGSFRNIQHFAQNSNFRFIHHDVATVLNEDIGPIDQIYHLACPGSPVDCTEIPLQILWTSAVGTKLMLELAYRKNATFLLASSASIYGLAPQQPISENYFGNVNPIGETSCYDEGKRFAESIATVYYKDFRFPLKMARIFETYGPRMRKRDGRVIADFIVAALNHEPVRIPGDGTEKSYFCYIDDMINGLIKLMNDPDFIGPMNLGNPQPYALSDVTRKIVELTDSSSIIAQIQDNPQTEHRPYARHFLKPDITLAYEKLKFAPKINFEEGLRSTIRFFQRS